MQLRTPAAWPRDEGDFSVTVNGGKGDPFALIALDERGELELVMQSPEECDRLIKAACAAKDAIIRQRAKGTAPHEPRIAGNGDGRCLDCGEPADGELHAGPEPLVISDSTIEQARAAAAGIAAGTWGAGNWPEQQPAPEVPQYRNPLDEGYAGAPCRKHWAHDSDAGTVWACSLPGGHGGQHQAWSFGEPLPYAVLDEPAPASRSVTA